MLVRLRESFGQLAFRTLSRFCPQQRLRGGWRRWERWMRASSKWTHVNAARSRLRDGHLAAARCASSDTRGCVSNAAGGANLFGDAPHPRQEGKLHLLLDRALLSGATFRTFFLAPSFARSPQARLRACVRAHVCHRRR
eukprot:4032136-Pleurochrysis_carterae.AAC.1